MQPTHADNTNFAANLFSFHLQIYFPVTEPSLHQKLFRVNWLKHTQIYHSFTKLDGHYDLILSCKAISTISSVADSLAHLTVNKNSFSIQTSNNYCSSMLMEWWQSRYRSSDDRVGTEYKVNSIKYNYRVERLRREKKEESANKFVEEI